MSEANNGELRLYSVILGVTLNSLPKEEVPRREAERVLREQAVTLFQTELVDLLKQRAQNEKPEMRVLKWSSRIFIKCPGDLAEALKSLSSVKEVEETKS